MDDEDITTLTNMEVQFQPSESYAKLNAAQRRQRPDQTQYIQFDQPASSSSQQVQQHDQTEYIQFDKPTEAINQGGEATVLSVVKDRLEDTNVPIQEQDRFLPAANLIRVMKHLIPDGAKISKEARSLMQECSSEFIHFLTAEAADYCKLEHRKTVTADDLLVALESLGFDLYVEPMKMFLLKYRTAFKVAGPKHFAHPNYNRPAMYQHLAEPIILEGKPTPVPSFTAEGEALLFDGKNGPNNYTSTLRQQLVAHQPCTRQEPEPQHQQHSQQQHQQLQQQQQIIVQQEVVDQNQINGAVPVALEQQQMQIYLDPVSKQHYAAVQCPTGIELCPIQIQSSQPQNIMYQAEQVVSENGVQQVFQQYQGSVPENFQPVNQAAQLQVNQTHQVQMNQPAQLGSSQEQEDHVIAVEEETNEIVQAANDVESDESVSPPVKKNRRQSSTKRGKGAASKPKEPSPVTKRVTRSSKKSS